ncbi:5'-nucleotidase C-terminal domain-containing protein [Seonamhaeicola sp.]|uniref:5'-nucleotidase C-terminal domain-containing protein n=1 Tax=Seonamhaeicola sp. TaxID=1912245 RepID=UPI002623CD30|nr:5'-nucleotidase C-terminal domain-containing protein [Seonamhaeicola sp.]
MRLTHLFFLLIFLILPSCKEQNQNLIKIEGKQIAITDTLSTHTDIESFIKPFRDKLEKDLDSVLAYSVKAYTKNDDELNTAIGNLMTDIIFSEANPIFNKRTGNNIDAVMLNHGGIRSMIPKGPITVRTAYEVMPFENKIVVVGLKGKNINDMVSYLVSGKRAHPFLGLKILLDQDYNLIKATINGENIDENKTYYVATNDYLYNNGDNMAFFKPSESFLNLDYKVRSAMIDYFKKVDTINPVRDDRFIRK